MTGLNARKLLYLYNGPPLSKKGLKLDKLPSLKLYTIVSFVSFGMLIFLNVHPSAKETFQYQDEISDLLKEGRDLLEKVEDEDANLEDQTIHWFAAVICVNMGK